MLSKGDLGPFLQRLAKPLMSFIWISNHINKNQCVVIAHPCPNFIVSLSKPPLMLGHGWAITCNKNEGVIIHLCSNLCYHVLVKGALYHIGPLCDKGITEAVSYTSPTLIAMFMGPTWGPSGADRTQVGPMLATWTLPSGKLQFWIFAVSLNQMFEQIQNISWYHLDAILLTWYKHKMNRQNLGSFLNLSYKWILWVVFQEKHWTDILVFFVNIIPAKA